MGAIVLQRAQLLLEAGDFQLIFVLRLQAPLPIDGVPDEIAASRAGDAVEAEREKELRAGAGE